jgi:DnaJ homolog subfamily B member 4
MCLHLLRSPWHTLGRRARERKKKTDHRILLSLSVESVVFFPASFPQWARLALPPTPAAAPPPLDSLSSLFCQLVILRMVGDTEDPRTTDLYVALAVGKDADLSTIKRAFKKLALLWHPDKNQSIEAQAKFHHIKEAYAVLSDPERRREYDLQQLIGETPLDPFLHRKSSFANGAATKQAWATSRSSSFARSAPTDNNNSSSGGGGSSSGGGASSASSESASQPSASTHTSYAQARSAPTPPFNSSEQFRNQTAQDVPEPADVRMLPVTLEDLFFGFHKRLKITRSTENVQGIITTSSVILTINGLPGWRNGTRVTFAEAGDKRFGRPALDVVIVIQEEEHPIFQRHGDDLTMMVQVPLFGALYGHTELIQTLNGKKINVPIARIAPGLTIVLPNEGMPVPGTQRRGNLLLKYKIIVPQPLRERIVALSSLAEGPTVWQSVPVRCTSCRVTYTEEANGPDTCRTHEGSLMTAKGGVVFSQTLGMQFREARVWSCCQRAADAAGCVAVGPHVCSEESQIRARETAAYNGLLAAARAGDAHVAAWHMLSCSVTDHGAPMRAAVEGGHFFITLLFVRDGADFSSLGGPLAALRRAAMACPLPGLAEQVIHVADTEPSLFQLVIDVPGAAQVVFEYCCAHDAPGVAARLLLDPLIGPVRCKLSRHSPAVTALLLAAARAGDVACLQLLAEARIDLDGTDGNGRSALHAAAEYGHLAAVELLLQACVRPGPRDRRGMRPLDVALALGHSDIVLHVATAMLEDTLLSMAGLTMRRLLASDGVAEAPARPADVRATLVVAEDALRNLCESSAGLAGGPLDGTDSAAALTSYDDWRMVLEDTASSILERNDSARIATDALIAAGVEVKAGLQLRLAQMDDLSEGHPD